MLILPERGVSRSKFLMAVPDREWRTPSQAQEKNCFGHENRTRFRVRALTHDGVPRWVGWFDDRSDFDAFLSAIANDTLKWDRPLWDLPAETWMPGYGWGNVGWRPDLGEGLIYDFVTVSFITSGTSWNVPSDCRGVASGSGEFIDTIGGGGSGASSGNIGSNNSGGGGGGWSRITSLSLTAGGSVTVQVGAYGAGVSSTGTSNNGNNGTDTWFNGASLAASSCGAKAGSRGVTAAAVNHVTGGAGGAAGSGIGSSKNSGGAGGNTGAPASPLYTSTGAGGAAGPNGNGTAGTNRTANNGGSAGGSGDAGSGGAGTATGNPSSAGGNGTEYDATHGSGGGSGSGYSGAGSATSGAGGNYGAGSGGACAINSATGTSGNAGPGLIVVAYIPRYGAFPFKQSPTFFIIGR